MKRKMMKKTLNVVMAWMVVVSVGAQSAFAEQAGNEEAQQLEETIPYTQEAPYGQSSNYEAACTHMGTLASEHSSVLSSMSSAFAQVKSYSFQGAVKMNQGEDAEMTMLMKGDINVSPEYAQRMKTTTSMAGMKMEQEMITVKGKTYVKQAATGGWMELPATSAGDDNLGKYFACDTFMAVQDVKVNPKSNELEVVITYDTKKYDELVVKQEGSHTTLLEQHMIIDTATYLPKTVYLNMEFQEGEQTLRMETEYAYTYNEEAKPIDPPTEVQSYPGISGY